MSDNGPETAAQAGAPTLDERRRRTMWRIAGGTALTGAVLAALAGFGGASGRVGFVVLMLVSALGTGAAALYGVVTALVDEARDREVTRQRILGAVGLFVGTAILMAMTAGLGG